MNSIQVTRSGVFKLALFVMSAAAVQGGVISFTGNLRTDATFAACGGGCTLNAGNTDGDYAQWAAVAVNFTVPVASAMSAITFSYGGGINGNGVSIAQGGFQPYLSLIVRLT
jgi:hypothetical protein